MRLVKSRKHHNCKKCNSDIWLGCLYYPQRRSKAICFTCGSEDKPKTFMKKLLNWLGSHGE